MLRSCVHVICHAFLILREVSVSPFSFFEKREFKRILCRGSGLWTAKSKVRIKLLKAGQRFVETLRLSPIDSTGFIRYLDWIIFSVKSSVMAE